MSKKNRLAKGLTVGTAASLLGGCAMTTPNEKTQTRPNIIFILTDDQRADAMGCAGDPVIQTPQMDALAAGGTLFENAYVTTAICAASRASILTGQYTSRHGRGFADGFSPEQTALNYPGRLQAAGYRTGFVGKHGVGIVEPKKEYDYFFGFNHGIASIQTEEDGSPIHLTRLLERHALAFLQDCTTEQPFCLSVSFRAPHVDTTDDPRCFVPDPQYDKLYSDLTMPVSETFATEVPDSFPEALRSEKTIARERWHDRFATPEMAQEAIRNYYRLITGVDDAIAAIRTELEEQGLSENTVIIFMGDNGLYLGAHGFAGKWYGHEESIRVPLIVYDPRTPEALRGRRLKEMALNIDIAPTLLELAGLEPSPGMQGRSLTPLLEGESMPWRNDFFYEHPLEYDVRIPKSVGVVESRYKYLRYEELTPVFEELYDIETDPHEMNNLIADPKVRPVLKRLRARCDELKEDCK